MEKESYITKKQGKPSVTRGRISEYENGVKVFEPYNQDGEPTRKLKKKLNDSSRYETEHKLAVNLQVPKDSPDAFAQMADEFLTLTKDMQHDDSPKIEIPSQCLNNQPDLQIWIEKEKGEVVVIQHLKCQPTIIRDCTDLERQTYQILERDREKIIKVWKSGIDREIIDNV